MSNPIEPQARDWCIHFTGVQNNVCKAGVSYQAMWDINRKLPCILDNGSQTVCEHLQRPAVEQIELDERQVNEMLEGLLVDMKTGVCPHCHKPLQWEKQIGRCVYGSCGCRLWQGKARTRAELEKAQTTEAR